jgi:hypothetical protein
MVDIIIHPLLFIISIKSKKYIKHLTTTKFELFHVLEKLDINFWWKFCSLTSIFISSSSKGHSHNIFLYSSIYDFISQFSWQWYFSIVGFYISSILSDNKISFPLIVVYVPQISL